MYQFKRVALVSALMVAGAFSQSANAVQVTVGGINYDLVTVTGTYASLQSRLEAQPWFAGVATISNYNITSSELITLGATTQATLARNISLQLGLGLPNPTYPNSGVAPFFAVYNNLASTSNPRIYRYYYFGANNTVIGLLDSPDTFTETWVVLSAPSPSLSLVDLSPNAHALRGAFNLQSAIINTGLTYDCTTFDAKGICVSAGGRFTDANNPSTNSQGALLIASYRATDNLRIGGYLDQNLSSNDARGVNLDNSNPMAGVFGVWNQNTDGTGYEVRVAAGYSDKDVTITRNSGLNTEAGKGDSSLQSTAVSATVSRGFALNNTRWIASPYLGLRYTKLERNGYTEDLTASVQNPLTYSALSQETTTALAGVRMNGRVGDKINLMASAGVENDINHNVGTYSANGMDSVAFNQNIRHIRPVASAGASYAIDKRQTIGANVNYRQEAFNSTNSVSGMVTYQVGF